MKQPPQNLLNLLGLHAGGDLAALTIYRTKRKLLVWFNKAPPTSPPSPKQTHQRNTFRLLAAAWSTLTLDQQQQWERAARRASLAATGYNAFLHFKATNDTTMQNTLQRVTNTVLT